MDSDTDMFSSQTSSQSASQSASQSVSQSASLLSSQSASQSAPPLASKSPSQSAPQLASQSPSTSLLPSQAANSKSISRYEYGWLIFFDWSPHILNPFNAYPVSEFSPNDIRKSWIEYQLSSKWRNRKLLPISNFPGREMSLFAKIEIGMFFSSSVN